MLDNLQRVVVPKEFIALNLSLSQFELMALTLSDRPQPVTMGGLAQGMSVPVSTATGIVDRLVKKGLLERGRNDDDRRVVTVCLSAGGKDVVAQFRQRCYDYLDRVRSILTADEFATALLLWRKVVTELRNDRPEAREKAVEETGKVTAG